VVFFSFLVFPSWLGKVQSGNGRRGEGKGGGVKSTKNEDAKKIRKFKIMNENERNAQVNTI
jgi:hypothetical protein